MIILEKIDEASMPIKYRENLISAWAFLIGIILALVVGVFSRQRTSPIILGILAILGIVVGFFVDEKNIQTFLLASVSLVIVSFAGIQGGVLSAAILGIVNVNKLITNVLGALMFLLVPATIIVALKTVFSLARS